ncbi:MAG TPA: hypothetical protein VF546_11045 [Pyrinomonadaceae bacterium]|jgi:hypothetical protein
MQFDHEAARTYARGLERLQVCQLLVREVVAKQLRGEGVEALELLTEALAHQREGFRLLDDAAAHRRAFERAAGLQTHA